MNQVRRDLGGFRYPLRRLGYTAVALESHTRFPKQCLCMVCEEGLFQQVARCLIDLGA